MKILELQGKVKDTTFKGRIFEECNNDPRVEKNAHAGNIKCLLMPGCLLSISLLTPGLTVTPFVHPCKYTANISAVFFTAVGCVTFLTVVWLYSEPLIADNTDFGTSLDVQ